MHKALGFEVMHFILYVRMWLHQGVPVAAPVQLGMHGIAKRIILLTLPNYDRPYVAIQDLADALIHSREGRTVHGHTRVGVTSRIQHDLRALVGRSW